MRILLLVLLIVLKEVNSSILYVVLAEANQGDYLRAAAKTWIKAVKSENLLFLSEKNATSVTWPQAYRMLRTQSLLDPLGIARTLVKRIKRTEKWWRYASIMIVPAATLVRPQKLELLQRRLGVYTGFVRDASELPYLGYMPHAALEHGILVRALAIQRLGKNMWREKFDFRSSEAGAAALASRIWDQGVAVTRGQNDRFRPYSARSSQEDMKEWYHHGITLGPIPSAELYLNLANMQLNKIRNVANTSLSLRFGVLVRETEADSIAKAIEKNWCSTSCSFYVSNEHKVNYKNQRIIQLDINMTKPENNDKFYDTKHIKKTNEWDLWLRHKVQHVLKHVADTWQEEHDWFMLTDDDTYVRRYMLSQALTENYDPNLPVAIGRKFVDVYGRSLIGGGPGIVLSRTAIETIRKTCFNTYFDIISHTVPGGDGWLGQCFHLAKVQTIHDWRFKSFPPQAYFGDTSHFLSFHRVSQTNVQQDVAPADTLCTPVQHWSTLSSGASESSVPCLPHYTILGAQKAGTTTLHYLLGQHPWVDLPKRKELNFWGSPWMHRAEDTSVRSFLSKYLRSFPLRYTKDTEIKVYGETSPDYLVSPRFIIRNMMRFCPKMRLIVSIREPIDRFISAYENKKEDDSIHRHLFVNDPRLDSDIPNYKAPSLNVLAIQANRTKAACPEYRRHYTMTTRGHPQCYVNPFVLHGYYARYLKNWLTAIPRSQFHFIDYGTLHTNPQRTIQSMAAFLQLTAFDFDTDQIYNSRMNRGVQPPSTTKKEKSRRRGATVSAISKSALTQQRLGSWTKQLDTATRRLLHSYYDKPNAELRRLQEEKSLFPPDKIPVWLL